MDIPNLFEILADLLNFNVNFSPSDIGFALFLSLFAGLSTGIGSIIAYFIRKPKPAYLAVLLSFSAGVMLYISFVEILGTAIIDIGFFAANIGFFIGIGCILVIDVLVPHAYEKEDGCELSGLIEEDSQYEICKEDRQCLMRTGTFIALGIAIHNFPEGIATFTSGISGNISLYITITFAIALHNIPEGISVSIPIYYASGSKKKAIAYSMLSGLSEPLGALLALIILLPFVTILLISSILAFVSGIMVYISLDELLPAAQKFGKEHLVLIGLISGMAVMVVSLIFLP
ncbi:MAG: zinc transporter ZupT [Candidatus Helarchaeota archaeon]